MQARVLLVSPLGVSLWCPQPAASGDEDAEGQLQFRSDSGISGRVLRTRELAVLFQPQSDPDFDIAVDAVLGAASLLVLSCHCRCIL